MADIIVTELQNIIVPEVLNMLPVMSEEDYTMFLEKKQQLLGIRTQITQADSVNEAKRLEILRMEQQLLSDGDSVTLLKDEERQIETEYTDLCNNFATKYSLQSNIIAVAGTPPHKLFPLTYV